ncbi:MAG: adenylosuccinate synthase [Candidatus Peribacteraceae bacterium]|nr:adenylosuccinate synthase [Candidatus Peribacteraceae bacterium]
MQQFLSSLGRVCAIIGAQWGDEGKGKATDILAGHFDVIARACGGANAGHTIVVKGRKHVFHLLPSGCLHEGKPVILGAGMVIHLPTLLEEIATLREAGIDILPRLHISHEAHIIFNYYKAMDAALEERRSRAKGQGIGTTKRGIGPAYTEKAARSGIRMERLEDDLSQELQQRAKDAQTLYGVTVESAEELAALKEAAALLADRVSDTVDLIHRYRSEGKTILVEGAQGVLLDIDHGSYPFVTSSSTSSAGALQALGLPPNALTSCIGIAKAYCTRVGSGTFLTEAPEEDAQRLRDRGGEYGATTGRPRRCGWLHLPDLCRGALTNGFTHWNITKLDVLDEEKEIPIGTGVDAQGKPVFDYLPGWQASTIGITSFEGLPENARQYIRYIGEQTGVPVALIGTGPEREHMIVKN